MSIEYSKANITLERKIMSEIKSYLRWAVGFFFILLGLVMFRFDIYVIIRAAAFFAGVIIIYICKKKQY